jgi:drug/metabolite transporter (DMT)-like permease
MKSASMTGPQALRRGLWLGLVGVVIFAATVPLTRMAVGTPEAPHMSSVFVALARAALAGSLSALYLMATRAPWPRRQDWLPLGLVSLGVVFGFPLLTSVALRYVEAAHAAVILGLMPLITAAVGALLHRQRPSAGFWWCAGLGSALVIAYALIRSGAADGQLRLHPADLLLLGAALCAAMGYGFGGRLSQHMQAEHVICWALLLGLPLALPATWLQWPANPVPASGWWALAYLGVFSMWLGFFAWYRGLALGGTVRVSQVQLLQPFVTMLLAVPLLGEQLDALTVGFGLAVIATVFLSKKMTVRPAPGPSGADNASHKG